MKDIDVVGQKITRNGRKIAKLKGCPFFYQNKVYLNNGKTRRHQNSSMISLGTPDGFRQAEGSRISSRILIGIPIDKVNDETGLLKVSKTNQFFWRISTLVSKIGKIKKIEELYLLNAP